MEPMDPEEKTTTTTTIDDARLPPNFLNHLIFGSPFSHRHGGGSSDSLVDPISVQYLDMFLDEIVSILRAEHGCDSRAFRQAERELYDVRHMPVNCPHAIACKRGVVLYALWKEPCFKNRFAASDPELVRDLCDRVLPLIGPPFIANLAQRPDAFVALCATIATMWQGENIRINVPQSTQHAPV